MDDTNKILDVTYGTFSCRLEGFEDSVETMKTVVSYFHDLAGHDRFMDMEPQAPDMETLARLTEEQSGVAVDIEGDGQRVSLRVAPAAAAASADDDIANDLDALAEESWDDEADADEEIAAEADAEDVAEDASEDHTAADLEGSVADKLQRIRAVVDRGPMDDADETYADELSSTEDTPAAANPLSQRLSELAKRTSEPMFADEPTTEDDDDMTADAREGDAIDEEESNDGDTVEDTVETAADAPEHDAEDDQREEHQDDDLPATENEVTDEDADLDDVAAEGEDDLAMVEAEDAVAEEDSADDVAVEEIADAVDAMDVAETADTMDDGHAEDMEAEEEIASDAASGEDAAEEELVAESHDDNVLVLSEDDADTDQASDEDAASDDNKTLILTSRDEDDDTEDDDDDDFDLHAEVAKVEAELAARPGNELARHGLPRSVDDAMSRILTQTNQHLDQPESRRHRDAFAQLKAAVAATEAARQLGDPGAPTKDKGEAFKDDLGAHDAQEQADASDTPASPPLKLVKTEILEEAPEVEEETAKATEVPPPAEEAQEAAAPEPAPAAAPKPMDAASERLRQIAAGKEASAPMDARGFKEFAAEQGADELIDMIEAAAAYLYYVEGNEDFSRPQVMKTVQAATGQEIAREDGLRAFGRLLRISKIVKLSNGRFRISESSEYRPDDAQAAQG